MFFQTLSQLYLISLALDLAVLARTLSTFGVPRTEYLVLKLILTLVARTHTQIHPPAH